MRRTALRFHRCATERIRWVSASSTSRIGEPTWSIADRLAVDKSAGVDNVTAVNTQQLKAIAKLACIEYDPDTANDVSNIVSWLSIIAKGIGSNLAVSLSQCVSVDCHPQSWTTNPSPLLPPTQNIANIDPSLKPMVAPPTNPNAPQRADEVTDGNVAQSILRGAGHTDRGFFLVPQVVDLEGES